MKRKFSSILIALIGGVLITGSLVSAQSTDRAGDGVYEKKGFNYYFETIKDNTRLGGYDDVAREGPITTAALIINWMLLLLGTVALCLTVYAGYLWMMAKGKEEDITKAKEILIGSTIGLFIIFSSYTIMSFVFRSFVNITD